MWLATVSGLGSNTEIGSANASQKTKKALKSLEKRFGRSIRKGTKNYKLVRILEQKWAKKRMNLETPLREGLFNRKALAFHSYAIGHGILLGLWLGRQHGKGGSMQVNLSLEGKHAVVCGSSAGIGEAVARRMAAHGAKVTLVARRAERLNALVDELAESGAATCSMCLGSG